MWYRRRPFHGYRPWMVKVPAHPHQPADELQFQLQLACGTHPASGLRTIVYGGASLAFLLVDQLIPANELPKSRSCSAYYLHIHHSAHPWRCRGRRKHAGDLVSQVAWIFPQLLHAKQVHVSIGESEIARDSITFVQRIEGPEWWKLYKPLDRR